ncbi:MAG TPA: hypothetical protein VGM47_07045 [Gammaproteobacteria bacterium]|jgi:hypothetical protein
MSSKITRVTSKDIRNCFSVGTAHASARDKSEFKVKKFTGAKSPFGVASACANGTVFGALGTRD